MSAREWKTTPGSCTEKLRGISELAISRRSDLFSGLVQELRESSCSSVRTGASRPLARLLHSTRCEYARLSEERHDVAPGLLEKQEADPARSRDWFPRRAITPAPEP